MRQPAGPMSASANGSPPTQLKSSGHAAPKQVFARGSRGSLTFDKVIVRSKLDASRDGMNLAKYQPMAVTPQLKQYAANRATKRLYRAMPWIGGLVALATFGAAVRRKGLLGGTANTVLDFIPWVGGAKNLAEAARGRDFIRDKQLRGDR